VTLAVVTGASRGIGRATALALAARGVSLALVGRPSRELTETAALARGAGAPDAAVHPCDLAVPSEVERVARELSALTPAPLVLVNDAGVAPRLDVPSTPRDVWEGTLAVNLTAPFLLCRELVPGMRRAKHGRIVNVGSISASGGTARLSAYVASKWGLVGFTKSLAAELTDSGVTAVCVLPGSTATRMLEGSGFPPRMTAEDVAKTLVHYALDAPAAHNGAVIEMFGT
jgi:NAD(P)-dependent dehydrogenase (short-subunit alcohol dehydrogenase family)